ncbi:MAG TPA: MMPL family transporter, partial [Bacteroidia bacterium]|nr:MMPL family transporter [Bacteroidia bacterium]
KGIFDQQFLARVQDLTDTLRKLPDVTKVISPSDLTYPTTTGEYPYLHTDDPSRFKTDSAIIYRSKELVGSFFSRNAKSVCLYIKTTEGISKIKSDTLLARMDRQVAREHFDAVHSASKMRGQKVYLDRLQREFFIFFISSFLLVVLFLFISFRSFWGIWVPIFVVLLSILWLLALMTALGKALDIMTVLIPTMMFVVGMSDVVHIVTKYLEELRDEERHFGKANRFNALLKTIEDVGFSTFITLITTSLGFLTLINSHILPIRDFGLYTSIGVFIAFILAFTIMPLVLNVIPQPNLKLEHETSRFWTKRLHSMLLWIFRNGKMIGAVTVVLTLLSLWGINSIERNNYLIEGLTRKDELRKDFFYFENNYSGVRPFEMVISPADSTHTVLGVDELRAADHLEDYLQKKFGVGFLLSPLSMVKEANKAENNGDPDYYVLPKDSSDIADLASEILSHKKRKSVRHFDTAQRSICSYAAYFAVYGKKNTRAGRNDKNELSLFISDDAKEGRISGKMYDVGSKVIRERTAGLDHFLATDPQMKLLHVKMTGAAVMLDKNNEYLISNMLQGLFLSVFVVGLILGIIHRSWKMGIIAIIPNFLPILFIGGIMGLFGVELNSSTSIIFSIAFGIATDDTVHFLGRLKLERKKGMPLFLALKRTYLSTGKAVIVTSLILSAGFFTLIASGFQSTFLFGLLVSVTLIIAVMTDLLLFPLLIVWMRPKIKAG